MSEYFGSIYEEGRKKQKVDSYKMYADIFCMKSYMEAKREREEIGSKFCTFLVPCEQVDVGARACACATRCR